MLFVLVAVTWVAAGGFVRANEFDYWHPFGRGTWRSVRVVTETLDDKGQVSTVSVIETKTTLVDASNDRVTLQVAQTIETAGRRFESEPARVVIGPYGEIPGEKVAVKPLSDQTIEVDGRTVQCRSRQVEIQRPDQRVVVQELYDNRVPPYGLRRTVTASDEKDQRIYSSTTDVVALQMPYKILSEIKPAAYVRTVLRNHKSMTTTLSVVSTDIPGQLVSASTKETDMNGRLLRRSTTELVNYEVVPAESKPMGIGVRTKRQERQEQRRLRRNG
jgi:hypothetical protein